MVEPVPIRDLGKLGIVKDVAPFDLPPNAWSDGSNVVFGANRVTSAPIPRVLSDITSVESETPPLYAAVIESANGYDPIITAHSNYTFNIFQNNTLTDITPDGNVPSTSDARYTSAVLAGLFYINRPDRVPLYYNSLTLKLEALPNWDSADRCRLIRAFKDFLIALNVTKGSTAYPTMFKWSDATLSGQVPDDWDTADLSSLAGENVFSEASSEIVDGLTLRNDFAVYTQNDVFMVEYIGGQAVFAFRRAFTDDGAIAQDCVVEVKGAHYVFGTKDIYVHDGASKRSLLEGRAKSYLYNSINPTKAGQCFAFHYPRLNSVFFCYPSTESGTYYRNPTHCNRAVVYNYALDNLSFVDLPNVSSATFANTAAKLTWETAMTIQWDQMGGQWADQDDDLVRHVVLTSIKNEGLTESRLIALDDLTSSKIGKPTSSEMLPPAYVQRSGITLEALGVMLDSRSMTSTLYPLVQQNSSASNFYITFGRAEEPDVSPLQYNRSRFDPRTTYKVDSRNTGRFLFLKFEFPVEEAVFLSGYDVKLQRISRR
jgi:hypothetical protein